MHPKPKSKPEVSDRLFSTLAEPSLSVGQPLSRWSQQTHKFSASNDPLMDQNPPLPNSYCHFHQCFFSDNFFICYNHNFGKDQNLIFSILFLVSSFFRSCSFKNAVQTNDPYLNYQWYLFNTGIMSDNLFMLKKLLSKIFKL